MTPPPLDKPYFCALFVSSPSPGAVFRFLERRLGSTDRERAALDALDLRLSRAAPPRAYRALTGGVGFPAWAQTAFPLFAEAFAPPLTLLWASADTLTWGYTRHDADSPTETQTFTVSAATPAQSALARLTRQPNVPQVTAAVAWAKRHRLPLAEVPALRGLWTPRPDKPQEVIDYGIVARLDQKSLLVENTPRLYCCRFGDAPGSALL